jgi:hypothetical protein
MNIKKYILTINWNHWLFGFWFSKKHTSWGINLGPIDFIYIRNTRKKDSKNKFRKAYDAKTGRLPGQQGACGIPQEIQDQILKPYWDMYREPEFLFKEQQKED